MTEQVLTGEFTPLEISLSVQARPSLARKFRMSVTRLVGAWTAMRFSFISIRGHAPGPRAGEASSGAAGGAAGRALPRHSFRNYVEQMRPIAKEKTGKTADGTKKTGEEEIPYARLPILLKKEAF